MLNIFDDGSQQDQTGVLSSSVLTGFGMGPGLDFTHHNGYCQPAGSAACLNKPTFGEPPIFVGGITFGSTPVDPTTGQLITNAGLSTIQVLNLMMGQGNDHLTVTGSLVPGPFSANGSIYTDSTDTTFNTYAQGGLTVVQGGGSAPLSVNGTFAITSTGSGSYSIVRSDQLNWGDYEFVVGQQLMWNGSAVRDHRRGQRRDADRGGHAPPSSALGTGVSGTIAVYDPTTSNHVAIGGNHITVTGGGGPGPGAQPPSLTATFTYTANTLTRTDGGSWLTAGFVDGMVLQVAGSPAWIVTGVTASTLTLSGPDLTRSALPAGALTVAGFAPSPLVIYGSTSQDGVWYSGNPDRNGAAGLRHKTVPEPAR